MANALLVGATGLVGSNILTTLLAHSTFSSVSTLSRNDIKISSSDKLNPFISDNSEWVSKIEPLSPVPTIFFSALAATRADAGGAAGVRKIDYDLNLALAKAAKERGVKCYVLISASGASPTSMLGAYTKMKGELEESIKQLDFERTVFLRPGLIMGNRTEPRLMESAFQSVVSLIGKMSSKVMDSMGQDANIIAKAAVYSGIKAINGEVVEKVWIVGQLISSSMGELTGPIRCRQLVLDRAQECYSQLL